MAISRDNRSFIEIGMNINEVIKRLKGIPCGTKATSCPDQLAKALEEIKEQYHID